MTSFVFTIISLVIACLSTANSHHEVMGQSSQRQDADASEDEDTPPFDAIFLHFTFVCAACFMLMAFTNWTLQGTPGKFELDRGTTSMWMRIATQWIAFAMYAWILVAPQIVKGRQYT